MKIVIHTFALSLLLFGFQAHAAKIELEFNGQKQIVEFNPNDETDMERAVNLWRKSDNRKYFIYSETGIFQVYDAPRDDAKKKEVGSWYQEVNSRYQQSPRIAQLTWDKSKWFPRSPSLSTGWIKLDDPNLIYPDQLKPVKEWPIRYMAYYKGIDTAAAEEGIKPKYDEYQREQFDHEGYLLDNRTMKRKKTADGNFLRMFQFRQFVKSVAVSPTALDVRLDNDGAPIKFNLKQFLAMPKVEYDKEGQGIYVWASFDDPVKPVYDKEHYNACVIDCENRKRWEP
ncbi:MAG: hypothetical protein KKH12_10480 [Gammaproteobacteria bacterium]|nr:hypothetical protein [Gammaproteobacteria bacterium]MBU1482087.1 hypothetical protein [Gammaproteobacteria bacterium]